MERHGSESYFVLGEGLLGESVGGREATLSERVEAAAPPFSVLADGPERKRAPARRGEPQEDR